MYFEIERYPYFNLDLFNQSILNTDKWGMVVQKQRRFYYSLLTGLVHTVIRIKNYMCEEVLNT